jgi:hypothetical protein
MHDPTKCLLGRLPSVHDPRTLRLRRFLSAPLPPPPPTEMHHEGITDWGIMGNTAYGNCVIVTAAHAIMAWYHATRGITDRIPDEKVITLSRQLGALNGYSILQRNKIWRNSGMWTNQTSAFAQTGSTEPTLHRQIIHTFGISDVGLAMPRAWQQQDPWDTGRGPAFRKYTWGGHSVPLVGYDEELFYCVTWGKIQAITPAALTAYCDEAYAIIDQAWLDATGRTPEQLDMQALNAALATVTAYVSNH